MALTHNYYNAGVVVKRATECTSIRAHSWCTTRNIGTFETSIGYVYALARSIKLSTYLFYVKGR